MDNENNPQIKNPQFKKNIEDIIMKIQQKPKIEPASTRSLDLLMATRRKELEEKQRKEEQKKQEDLQRIKDQNKLKERVTKSKALVDNKKELEEKRQKKKDDFLKGLRQDKRDYEEELERRKQKVYNRPLMFEQDTTMGKKIRAAEKAREIINEEENDDYENYNKNEITGNNATQENKESKEGEVEEDYSKFG